MRSEELYSKLRVLTAFRLLFVTILLAAFVLLQVEFRLFTYPGLVQYLIALLYLVNIFYLFLIKYRRPGGVTLGYIQLVLDVVFEIILIVATGGIESWFTVMLLLTVISSAMVMGRRAGYIIATLASILYGTVIDLQYYRILPITYSAQLTEKDFFYNIVINLMAVYLTAYLIGYLSSGLESTRRSLDEKSLDLRELAQFHTDVIENIPSGLFSTDVEGYVRLFNSAAEQITGIGRDRVLGVRIDGVFPFVTVPLAPCRLDGIISTGHGDRIIGMSISEHRNQDGRTVGYIGTFQDLTLIRRLEEEMQKKEKFAVIGELSANIAHEIRNPLASIKGSIEMLRENSTGPEERSRLMEIAIREMERLDRIIADFLNYSNPRPLEMKECDVARLLSGTVMLLKSSVADDERIEFEESIESPLCTRGDGDKLRQVFWNLLSNAVEALENGGTITVRAAREGDTISVQVSDNGTGIREEDQERIFYPFYTTKKEGTGLGLAIAYRIVEEHGGRIEVRSREGEGASFIVTLPSGEKTAAPSMQVSEGIFL